MRFCIFLLLAISIGTTLYSQDNNPQNQTGIDFASSLGIIKSDFDNGVISAFDESSIAKYSRSLPLNISARFENVTSIVSRLKSADFNFENILSVSSFSQFSKNILSELAKNPDHLTKEGYLQALISKVDLINQSILPADEKKLMLSLAAAIYHTVDSGTTSSFGAKSNNCWGTGPDGSGPVDCVVVGIVAGTVVGSLICGFWPCGVIGGIVGGIIGGLT